MVTPRRIDPPAVPNRRSLMTLFSAPDDAQSHRVRVVLMEKGIGAVDIVDVPIGTRNEDLAALNPYDSLPTLVDRELVLYDPQVISEYLDERFPHPSLMPVDPVNRAKMRMALFRVEQDIYSTLPDILDGNAAEQRKAKKELTENLTRASEIFTVKPFFLSDEFSLVDCALAPVLWRLPSWGIELPASASAAISRYTKRIFSRETFKKSLTPAERELNKL